MDSVLDSIADKLRDLSDLEFEILFIDDICKRLKRASSAEIRSESLLIVYLSIIEILNKFKFLAKDSSRSIPHEDAIGVITNKIESYLSAVADDEAKVMYVSKSLSEVYSFTKDLFLQLKKELVETPKYSYLNQQPGVAL